MSYRDDFNAPRAILGQEGATKTGVAQPDASDAARAARVVLVKDELARIGKNRQALSPSELEGCENILRCDVVQRVAHENALTLQQAAYCVILKAIASRPTRERRAIAAGMLAARPRFDNKNVNQRRQDLSADYAIRRDDYRLGRPKVLTEIAVYLVTNSHESRSPSPHTKSGASSIRDLDWFAFDIALVWHMLSAHIFAMDFYKAFRMGLNRAGQPKPDYVVIHDPLFDSYLALVRSSGWCFGETSRYSARSQIMAFLPDAVGRRISDTINEILDAMPFSSDWRQQLCDRCFGETTSLHGDRELVHFLKLRYWHFWLNHDLDSRASQISQQMREVARALDSYVSIDSPPRSVEMYAVTLAARALGVRPDTVLVPPHSIRRRVLHHFATGEQLPFT